MFKNKKGMVQMATNAVITLIVGVGVGTLVLIFVGVLGGQTYNLTEAKIDNISDAEIKADVKSAIKSGFTSLKQVGDYMPLVVLAIIIMLVLALVLSMTGGFGGAGRGSAL